jgi:hypothetical protein
LMCVQVLLADVRVNCDDVRSGIAGV